MRQQRGKCNDLDQIKQTSQLEPVRARMIVARGGSYARVGQFGTVCTLRSSVLMCLKLMKAWLMIDYPRS